MTRNKDEMTGLSRRKFIGQAGAVAVGAVGLSGMQLNLEAVRAAAAENPDSTGYKALVCILLSGGNDSYNMLVPHAEHASYVTARGGLYTQGRGSGSPPRPAQHHRRRHVCGAQKP